MQRLIIDCDPGVDDALAIMLALEAPGVRVERISTVDGNVDLDKVTSNAGTVLKLCGRGNIPVHRGVARPLVREPMMAFKAHGSDGLGNAGYWDGVDIVVNERDAVTALLEETAATPNGPCWS